MLGEEIETIGLSTRVHLGVQLLNEDRGDRPGNVASTNVLEHEIGKSGPYLPENTAVYRERRLSTVWTSRFRTSKEELLDMSPKEARLKDGRKIWELGVGGNGDGVEHMGSTAGMETPTD